LLLTASFVAGSAAEEANYTPHPEPRQHLIAKKFNFSRVFKKSSPKSMI